MNRRNDYIGLLEMANDELKDLKMEIKVSENDDGFYAVDIIEWREDGTKEPTFFAENFYEDELADCISDAWAHAKIMVENKERRKALEEQLISFRMVDGGTHQGTSNLIWSFTDVTLYFHDTEKDSIECVDKAEGGIDDYVGREGVFCVHVDDYDLAEQQIYEHEELGIEH